MVVSTLREYSKEWLEELCRDSRSLAEVLRKAGRKGGGAQETLKRKIQEFGIDISHFMGQGWNKNNFDYSRFQHGKVIKANQALDALAYLRGRKCEKCGRDKWLEQPIPLEVHHIDGDHLNSTVENLQILCPNCHALTENWRGKNISKKNFKEVPEEEFVKALQENPSIRKALISLGLTAAGGNYDRAYNLIYKYNIVHLIK